ncbi:MAG: ACP S-malonyltransferase [Succinimonas sp.]|nr:ACP S-malonyltransferase [Succinimonas sp.]
MTDFAFVFPGQGSQSVGMLKEVYDSCEVVRETFKEASAVLGYDLYQLVSEGPAEELGKTFKTQPALLTSSVALYSLWCSRTELRPKVMAGHSLGEYSALVCAGAVDFKDAVNLVKLRGEFMQEAVPAGSGAMAAVIGLDDSAVKEACAAAAEGEVCSAVNFNSPGQVVIAGSKAAVDRAGELLKAAGAKRFLPLAVSVPSHCDLMKPAAERLKEALKGIKFQEPEIPVINNVDVTDAIAPDVIKDALVRQLYSPVRWVETEQAMAAAGVSVLVEVGPGKVLQGLSKRIVKEINALTFNDLASLDAALEAVK